MKRVDYITNSTLLTSTQKQVLHNAKKHAYRSPYVNKYLASIRNQDSEPVEEKAITRILENRGIYPIHRPRNVAEIEQLYEKLTYFMIDREDCEIDIHMEKGFSLAYKLFARPKEWVREGKYLRCLESYDEVKAATKLEKTSGAPFFTRKGDVFDECWRDFKDNILTGKKNLPPATAYCRTYPDNKTRLVFAQATQTIMLEGQFARPLISYFLENRNPMMIGMWNQNLGDWLSTRMNKRYVYTFDYSKFDMTISRKFIIRAFNILATWFSPEDRDRLGWNMMVKNFIYTGIIMPDGLVYYGKRHGVPSGSYFTQLIDSVVNVAIIMAISSQEGMHVNADHLAVLGDDSIFCSYTWVDIGKIAKRVEQRYKIIIHPEKSEVLDTYTCNVFHFLGKYWYLGVPHREEEELYSKMNSPERRRNLSWKSFEQAIESNFLIDTVVQAYCADCDEGIRLAGLLRMSHFKRISFGRISNMKRALPGGLAYKLESMSTSEVKNTCEMGIVGMYAR